MKRIFRSRNYHPEADRDLADELEAHLELMVDDLMAEGMSEEEARARALQALSRGKGAHATAAPQARRNLRRRSLRDRFDAVVQDLRYALRRMIRSPGFTLVALLSLAIGIGANTAVFSVSNTFLIRKAPFRAPHELVRIFTSNRSSLYQSTSYLDFRDMRAMEGVFADVGASDLLLAVADIGGEPRRVSVEALSADLLPMLGVGPVLGRGFLPEEDAAPGTNPVAILGYGFWQRAFAGSPEVLGRAITLAGRLYTVVGVTPEWFGSTVFGGIKVDLFVPLTMAAAAGGMSGALYRTRDYQELTVLARLAPGSSVEEARTRLDLLGSQLREAYPQTNQDRTFRALPENNIAISPKLDRGIELTAGFLLVVVGLVLLLACTNLASFLLARGVQRRKEVAMRLALGAGRGRLIRQLLTETVVLGLLGGALGLLVARTTLAFMMAYQPPLPISLSLDLGLDGTVFLFTLLLSMSAGILFGLVPAIQSTKPDVAPTLKGGGGGGSRRRLRLQTVLVALQMTISMILLVGGGLFLRTLVTAQSMDPGFSTGEAGIAWIDLAASQVPHGESEALRLNLEERLLAQPGVQEVASASRLPLSLGNSSTTFRIPGVEPPRGQDGFPIQEAQIGPGYFHVMGIPILSGRPFTPEDRTGAPAVVVVSQELARRFWPGEDPLGKRVYRGSGDRPLTVVGVARDTKISTLGEPPTPYIYFSIAQFPPHDLQLVIRGGLPSMELAATLRRVLKAYPSLVVMQVETMREHLSLRLFGYRSAALLLGFFGILALLLSSIGLYGVVSFSVSRRMQEMGIRISLGADPGRVVRLVVGRAMGIVVVGGLIGLAMAALLARLIRVFLVGVSPADPSTLVGVPLLLGGVAVVAAFIPARRAGRVDPVAALRRE